ncbi:hypothetical protein LCGC14_1843290, partial [marine sediment metagenome]
TGAFNTVHAGQMIFVESTAEGQEGHFYEMVDAAQVLQRRKAHLTELDFKFHFYPWWRHPGYRLDYDVPLTVNNEAYFDKLAAGGIELDEDQRAWYAKKAIEQGDDMGQWSWPPRE